MSTLEKGETATQLERTELILRIHRRLHDDSDLFNVLALFGSDDTRLNHVNLLAKKRKLIQVLEESAELMHQEKIDPESALFLFGQHAYRARYGKNFSTYLDFTREGFILAEFADKWFRRQSAVDTGKQPASPLMNRPVSNS